MPMYLLSVTSHAYGPEGLDALFMCHSETDVWKILLKSMVAQKHDTSNLFDVNGIKIKLQSNRIMFTASFINIGTKICVSAEKLCIIF